MNIFVCLPLTSEQISRLQTALPGQNLYFHAVPRADPAARQDFKRCEVVFGNPPPDWVAASSSLNWIQLESVGFGEYADLDWQELGKRLQVTNLAGFFSEPVAESILAGVLSHCRGLQRLALYQARHEWWGEKLRPSFRILRAAQVVLFGKGDINRRVAELLEPFGCILSSFGRSWQRRDLEATLQRADIVICTVPDNLSTRGVFDRNLLGLIKKGGLFVNFGRGSLIDEAALADALESGYLSGAVIDVTQDEPLPPGHRFWTAPNMLLTQHTGGGTADEMDRKIEVFLANFNRQQRQEPLHGAVAFMKVQ